MRGYFAFYSRSTVWLKKFFLPTVGAPVCTVVGGIPVQMSVGGMSPGCITVPTRWTLDRTGGQNAHVLHLVLSCALV